MNLKTMSRLREIEDVTRETIAYLERLPKSGATQEVIAKLNAALAMEVTGKDCVFEGHLILPAGISLLDANIKPRILTLKTSAPRRHDADLIDMLRGRGLQMPIQPLK